MAYQCDLGGTRFRFPSLKTLLARATPERSGDHLAGVAAETPLERVAAQMALANVPLTDFLDDVLEVDGDGITALIFDQQDAQAFAPIRSLTVGGFRDWLLAPETTGAVLRDLAPGLTPEMVAATSKLMRVQDLIAVSRKIEIVTRFRSTIGLAGRLSTRNQPNHPTDDSQGIALSALDGLMMGAGDAVIGVNPATDSVADFIRICDVLDVIRSELDVPTQTCCLGHVTTALDAMQADAPVDLVFQSIAGSDKANDGFGVTLAMLDDAHEAVRALGRAPDGANLMYFETGQGAALSAEAHFDMDQQTMEARAYAVARRYRPLLVNTVVGFIGPEYLADGKQILRAGLEDHFCGKLLGLPMGVDICYTNHSWADQDDMDHLLVSLAAAGVSFVITVPGADDIMLNYQSLAFHDAQFIRDTLGHPPAPEFADWMARIGIGEQGVTLPTLETALGRLRLPAA
ncbi:MAG: ethanolamine ammonia-lyase subunit EutB [Rhodobacteraceae bacterium]|nr:ethanolamine ammonia-lyase subunit EutB [Paracoccaceae bacterium]